MKPNLQDYLKFYRWLTLPFTRKPRRVQASTAWSFVGCF